MSTALSTAPVQHVNDRGEPIECGRTPATCSCDPFAACCAAHHLRAAAAAEAAWNEARAEARAKGRSVPPLRGWGQYPPKFRAREPRVWEIPS